MLFIMLFFAEIMLKNMLVALHYAKLFQILLNYALHQKYISLSTAGQNKRLFCRNSYLGIQALSWCQCKSRWITEGEEKRKRATSS